VLVVDDQEFMRDLLREALEDANHDVEVANGGMSPMSGIALIEQLRREFPSIVSVVITGHGTIERTVELMRVGAFDVLTKPCSPDEIAATVQRALEHQRALQTNTDLRDRLRVQEKLAMIGKLAAGVAHELNNPLDASLRCVRLIRDRMNGDAEATEYIDLAEMGMQRMADIVQSLLTFSRNAAVEQAPQALESLLEEAASHVRLAIGDEAPPIEVTVDASVAQLSVPRGMHQVLSNLLRNACDATSGLDAVDVRASRNGEALVIEVVDRGAGIPEHILPRVFEPFFTTKAPGSGTGLGLPISVRLVEKFGGALRIECPKDGGTLVTVTLPVPKYTPEPMAEAR
jgi:signal transduction histidine kinase